MLFRIRLKKDFIFRVKLLQKPTWQYTDLRQSCSAERLANGNTLIGHYGGVQEVDQQGKIIWQKKMTGVYHATRY